MDRDFEFFFKMHERRIHYQIHRLRIDHALYEDYYAVGVVALWHAYKNYSDTKGELGTFLNYQIRYRLIDLQREQIRIQALVEQSNREQMVRLDTGNRCRSQNHILHDTSGIEVVDTEFWHVVRARLSEKQWKWVVYFIIADLSVKEIMEIENVSKSVVVSWGQAVRRKLRNEEMFERLQALI